MTGACIVVIGHVDHGKTALVHALTGMDTDRLTEEKQRGLSITAGYAHRNYASGMLDLIDAPGHADFIPAMVAGATGARAVLIVISAHEGIGAQTLEHLRIAELLGIRAGVIALTKSDLLDPVQHDARCAAILNDLTDTAYAGLRLVICSAQTGAGIETLHAALEEVVTSTDAATGPLHSFLPIDRAFTLEGRGTIVTGTLQGQDLTLDRDLALLPQGQQVRLRGLQSRGAPREIVRAGERTAANLRGIAVDEVIRGSVLCEIGAAAPSTCIDVAVEVLPDARHPLKHNQDIRVLFGTSIEVANLRLFGGGQMAAGSRGFAQLRFKTPVVGFAGQRAILRRLSPAATIGGAVFLDPQSTPARASDTDRLQVLQASQDGDVKAIAEALSKALGGLAKQSDVARLSRISPHAVEDRLGHSFTQIGPSLFAKQTTIEACASDILVKLATYHSQNPLHIAATRPALQDHKISTALFAHVIDLVEERGDIRLHGQRIALCDHYPLNLLTATQQSTLAAIETEVLNFALTPPAPADLARTPNEYDLLQLSIDLGRLVELPNVALGQMLLLHAETLTAAAQTLRDAFPLAQLFTTSEARVALGTSRRVIVPVLEFFDAQGVTARTGNTRHMASPISVPPSPSP
ncbi:selenocysteine-specific translation elongation factor [uncultured Sulfitobacter sp.]|uniref:selenocysteine-specific translation elongation factor n=1 Tax=uncultured Sulfitobacter sp. TaxID=191468 RepID=UPI002625BCD3|nr:selenocysteine-specific translation elongation factor [uncultured Sulfitobacter sp.]